MVATKATANSKKAASPAARLEEVVKTQAIGHMEILTLKVIGITPLIQRSAAAQQFDSDDEDGGQGGKRIKAQKKVYLSGKAEAEAGLYKSEDGRLYHPADAFRSAIIDAVVGTTVPSPNSKRDKSATEVFGFAMFATRIEAFLIHPETGEPLTMDEYKLDTRNVVNPTSGGMVPRSRARWDVWACEVELEYDPMWLTPNMILQGANLAGARVGVGELRPTPKKKNPKKGKGGRYGKFRAEFMEG